MDSARYPPPATNSGSAYLDWMVDASLTEIGYSNQATPTLSSQLYPNVSESHAYSYLPTYYITEPTVGAVTQPSLAITTPPTLPAYYEYAPQGPVAVPHFLTPSTTHCPRSPSQLSGYPHNYPPDYFLSSGKGVMPGGGGRGRAQRNRDRNVSSPTSSRDFTERVSSRSSRSSVGRAPSSLADTEDVASQSTARGMSDDEEDECRMSGTSSVTPSEEPRKVLRQNHSEIEKRRRDKMNTYITELSKVVPMCITMSHKMDKLTVLRMAVQHLKTIRGAIHSYTEGDYKPAFLSDEELKRLILHSADGFLFVVGCDRGRILYVSETVSQVLNYSQADLLGQSWFDILHPKDVAKVKEQLSSSDLSPRERLIDAKTMLPVKTDMPQGLSRLCPGARRSFFCRMKCKSGPQYVKEEADSSTGASVPFKRRAHNLNKEKRYSVIHCTGYLKSWAPAKIGMDDQDLEGDIDPCNLSCLVAVGRVHPSAAIQTAMRSTYKGPELKPVEFTSRHAIDGKFLFIDQRATLVLGYLPQEMLGTSMYEYYLGDDIPLLTEAHKVALQSSEYIVTPVYKFRVREGSYVRLQSRWKSFRNPWTKEIECLVAKNTFIHSDGLVESSNVALAREQPSSNCSDLFSPGTSSVSGSGSGNSCSPALRVRGRGLNMDLESSKIGQAVADHVLDSHRRSNPASNNSMASSDPSPSTSVSNMASPEAAEAIFGSVNLSNLAVEDVQRVAAGFPNAANMDLEGNPTVRNGNPFPRNGILNNHQHEQPNQVVRTNPQLLHMLNEAGLQTDQDMIEAFGGFMMNQESTSNPSLDVEPANTAGSGDGHDEAAMAVVMSLLEADAGLGGPVDFSGLPWPLP